MQRLESRASMVRSPSKRSLQLLERRGQARIEEALARHARLDSLEPLLQDLMPGGKGVEALALALGKALGKPGARYASEEAALDSELVRRVLCELMSVKRTEPEKRRAIREIS